MLNKDRENVQNLNIISYGKPVFSPLLLWISETGEKKLSLFNKLSILYVHHLLSHLVIEVDRWGK